MSEAPEWKPADEAMFWLNELEKMQGGANGPTIKLRAALLAMGEPVSATIEARAPLDDAQALTLARKHLA